MHDPNQDPQLDGPDDFEDAVNVYGAWDDDRLGELIGEFNDCLPGLEHVYSGACGDVRCQNCGTKFTP